MRSEIRLPVFDEDFLFKIWTEVSVEMDKPDYRWIDGGWTPDSVWSRESQPYDSIAHHELTRLLKFKTCAFCRNTMVQVKTEFQLGMVLACPHCFYWGGRGTRRQIEGVKNGRGILGRMRITQNPDDLTTDALIQHLATNEKHILTLKPKHAEKLLPLILKDVLNCEVLAIGGTKDGGIDALALLGDNEKMIIQIKWRESSKGSESIAVVREVGGTLLARGIPNGMIVSTRSQFSKTSHNEAKLISDRTIDGIGKLDLNLRSFNDLLDMFQIARKKRSEMLKPEDIIPYYDDINFFGGG